MPIFVTMMLLSAVVAIAGVLLDSAAVVVGPMAIAPLPDTAAYRIDPARTAVKPRGRRGGSLPSWDPSCGGGSS
jgi:hypothetical protein